MAIEVSDLSDFHLKAHFRLSFGMKSKRPKIPLFEKRSAPCVLHEPWKAKVDLIMSEAPFALTRRRSRSSLKIAGTRAWRKPQTPLKLISGKTSYSVVLREQMCGWGTSIFILGKPKDFFFFIDSKIEVRNIYVMRHSKDVESQLSPLFIGVEAISTK